MTFSVDSVTDTILLSMFIIVNALVEYGLMIIYYFWLSVEYQAKGNDWEKNKIANR